MRALHQRLIATALIAGAAVAAGCSGSETTSPAAPTSASVALTSGGSESSGPNAAPADGSTLKATAPQNLSPANRDRVNNRRPTLQWAASTGRFLSASGFSYDLELYRNNDLVQSREIAGTSYQVESDLASDTLYRWRVRARLGSALGPWAATADFLSPLTSTPQAPVVGGGGGGTPFGPQRSIGLNEAIQIIINHHNRTGANLGSGSSRESRVAWLWAAVATVHYGHSVFNPAGGDRGWCVKDAGGGRPPSDDVIVDCNSREAWDLISGAGVDGYRFDWHSVGRLGSEQNVYPPPLSSLPK